MTRVIAECTTYLGLVGAMRARVAELGVAISSDNAADISGLAGDHLVKLLNPEKSHKFFGLMSLGAVLGLLGVKLQLVEDEAQTRRVAKRIVKRSDSHVRDKVVHFGMSKKKLSEMGKIGGPNSRKGIPKKESRKLARKAALTRHCNGLAAKRSEAARHAALMRWSPTYRASIDQNAIATPAPIAEHASL